MNATTVVIMNPAAGSAKALARDLYHQVHDQFEDVFWYETQAAHDATQFAASIPAICQRVIVIGGDGTVHEVVQGLMQIKAEERPTLWVMPAGTGCDFARGIGLKRHMKMSFLAREGSALRVDVGAMHDVGRGQPHYFLNEVSAGLSAEVVQKVGAFKKSLGGRLGFWAGTLEALLSHRPLKLQIAVDDQPPSESTLSLCVAANGTFFGGGMHIAPRAQLFDGYLELVLVEKVGLLRFMAQSKRLYDGSLCQLPFVSTRRVQKVVLKAAADAKGIFEADGEAIAGDELKISLHPKSLPVWGIWA